MLASRGRKPFKKTLGRAPAKLEVICLQNHRRKTRDKEFPPKSCFFRPISVMTSPAPSLTAAGKVWEVGWVREEEHELLTQGFLESFWDDEIGQCLTSGGKFFSGLPWELVQKARNPGR